jgi:E3 ubiquitin-protein ligase ATL10/75/76/77/78
VATILIIIVCVSLLAFSLVAAAHLLIRCLTRAQALALKLLFDIAGGVSFRAVTISVWAEAERAICLSELADGEPALAALGLSSPERVCGMD